LHLFASLLVTSSARCLSPGTLDRPLRWLSTVIRSGDVLLPLRSIRFESGSGCYLFRTSETLRATVRIAPRTTNSSTAKAFEHSLAAAEIELRGLPNAAIVLRNDTRYSCNHKMERFICRQHTLLVAISKWSKRQSFCHYRPVNRSLGSAPTLLFISCWYATSCSILCVSQRCITLTQSLLQVQHDGYDSKNRRVLGRVP